MRNLSAEYRRVFNKEGKRSLYVALLILALSLIFQYYVGVYSTARATQFVGDLFLDNLPVVNVNPIIIEGALWAVFATVLLVAAKPRYLIFTLKAVAVFLAIRAFFNAVTHLGIYPDQLNPGNGTFSQLYVATGLETGYFFSAHTGLPAFMALIFWREKIWRFFFATLSVLFGISVLLAHVHYSIDVFAAPFMAYAIFKLSEYLFSGDYQLIQNDRPGAPF